MKYKVTKRNSSTSLKSPLLYRRISNNGIYILKCLYLPDHGFLQMKCITVIACMFTVCSAFFFPFINLPNQRQSVMNICIYSVDPARYQPKCFLCPTTAYPNVLQTCVRAATIPRNISFTQAACIEQNCLIGRGKRSVENESENYKNDIHSNLHSQENEETSSDDNTVTEESVVDAETSPKQPDVIETHEFFANDDTDYIDTDYEIEYS